MHKLDNYIGRIVRLKHEVFEDVAGRARPGRAPQENFFLVAAVSRGMHTLVCYGANLRITVGAADVVLV